MNVLVSIVGSVLTATVGTTTIILAADLLDEHKTEVSTFAEAVAIGEAVTQQWLLDDFALPQTLTCAAEPCKSFIEVPIVHVTGDNTVRYSLTGTETFTVTVTAEDGTAATYDSSTGTTVRIAKAGE